MIVLWGIPSEPPLRLAIESAQRAGLEHVVVNQRDAAHHDLDVDLTRRTHGTLVVDGVETTPAVVPPAATDALLGLLTGTSPAPGAPR